MFGWRESEGKWRENARAWVLWVQRTLDERQDFEREIEWLLDIVGTENPTVVDQSVREICRLESDSKLDLSRWLLELQSMLEGSNPKFASLLVKGLGFLIRVGFERNHGAWSFISPQSHPFVKVNGLRWGVEDGCEGTGGKGVEERCGVEGGERSTTRGLV